MSAILDLDELLTRVAHLVKRLIDYRTFGIALVNEPRGMVEFKVAISYGEGSRDLGRCKLGEGLLGYAVQHKEVVLVPDVVEGPALHQRRADARSELVVPLLVKDRCIGAFDLESPELNAFSKRHVELLTLLASQAAVAIENARLWEAVRANEERLEKEAALRPARADGAAAARSCRSGCARCRRGVALRAGARAGRRPLRLPRPRSRISSSSRSATCRARACRRRSTASFAGEVVRGRTFRRRVTQGAARPGGDADVDQPHPARAAARGVLLHAVLRAVRPAQRTR